MAKQIMFDDTARQKMRDGIDKLAKTVRVTLGPAGRNVILQKSFGSPSVTKDGVSVAKEIELEDPFESMGAKLVREVASKTNDVAGDGTTTATVLAQAIFKEGLKLPGHGRQHDRPAQRHREGRRLRRGLDREAVAQDQEQGREGQHRRDLGQQRRRDRRPARRRLREGRRRGRDHRRGRTPASRPCSTWSRAWSSTRATCRPTSPPT